MRGPSLKAMSREVTFPLTQLSMSMFKPLRRRLLSCASPSETIALLSRVSGTTSATVAIAAMSRKFSDAFLSKARTSVKATPAPQRSR